MSRLILHIGTPKTGSTALQHYLSANAQVFSERNVLYPEFPPQFPKYDFSVARANGAFLRLLTDGLVASGDARSLTKHHDESFHVLQGALSGSGTVVLSDEMLWKFDYRRWMEALGIVRELGASEVDFVVYLRRQDLLCSSWWRNDASKGGIWTSRASKSYWPQSIERLIITASSSSSRERSKISRSPGASS